MEMQLKNYEIKLPENAYCKNLLFIIVVLVHVYLGEKVIHIYENVISGFEMHLYNQY